MTTKSKGRNRGNGATPKATDHGGNDNATASFLGNPPRVSKYRQKLIRRALADVAERPLAIALLSALQNRGAA